MAGRAAMRTPEPPDRDEHEDSPPRLSRPRRTTRPPNNYAREQEIDIEQRKTRSQQQKKKTTTEQEERNSATSDDSSAEDEDPSIASLVKELVKLRREIRQRDESHKKELREVKEEFSAALAEVRHELQTLTDRHATPQPYFEACSRDNHRLLKLRNPYLAVALRDHFVRWILSGLAIANEFFVGGHTVDPTVVEGEGIEASLAAGMAASALGLGEESPLSSLDEEILALGLEDPPAKGSAVPAVPRTPRRGP
ncbi:uncharacterized protein N7498_008926 [Penicillium cinerascens]|uniref:Uncharacterized protein n=1 Tax=Penicillium cinerascens TaxID=70096 RepID=A0A9W9MB47_9EURO|nr:uncharacterized protein N7498_008926 [Penicillium cinerascens]KAJ5195488.1 hypothetical protein N7498_008926 [Penicillium cinerascens]